MSFDDLPPQPSINPRADAYAAECLRRSRNAAATARGVFDVGYGADYWQKLDLYLPADKNLRGLPVFMFLHGGGWTSGYKEWCGFMGPAFTPMPAIFVSVSYRLIPQVAYPAPCLDTVAAVKFVWDHIADYGGARERIVIGGHSAGASISALVALHPGWLAQVGLPDDVLKACICLSGTFNRRSVADKYPEHVQPGDPVAIQPDSPIALAGAARIPFYITWGGAEDRQARTGRQMIDALKSTGRPVDMEIFPGCDHFAVHLKTGDANDPWTRKVQGYLARAGAVR